MTIEAKYPELFTMCKHTATTHLGGPKGASGNDIASWAEDVAQEVILELLEREEKGEIDDNLVFGLAKLMAQRKAINMDRITRRQWLLRLEHRGAINRKVTGGSAELLGADPCDLLIQEETAEKFKELSPLVTATYELHYEQGLEVAEIARMQDVTEDVIYKRLQRARDFIIGVG